MDFDEIEYLEKTVEEKDDIEDARKSRKGSDRSRSKRVGEEEEDERRKGKRSKLGEEENGHERSGRDKDKDRRTRDRDRDLDRDRRAYENEKEDKDKDKERIRDRERSHKEKERSKRDSERKERDRVRDNEREKEKDRENSKYREKDKERSERREKTKEREREGPDHDRDARERSRSSSRSRRNESEKDKDIEIRDSRRYKEKKENPEPELDPERDQKTVFAYQMPLKATERDVYEFFSKAGKVRDVRLIMDRNSRRSKGVGYIEFYDPMAVPMAIALCGQLLLGQPVMVKPSEAEKNLVQSNSSSGGAGGAGIFGPVDRKLYVGNLHFNMTELQLRQIFEPYGTVELVQMPLDLETGHCKGFGFVQFAGVESAKIAQMELNGKLEIAGRYIKISSVTEHGGQQDNFPKNTDLDDDEGGGLALNAQSRALLMQRLDRTGTAASIVGNLGIPVVNQAAPNLANGQTLIGPTLPPHVVPSESVGQPSECLLLKNMFDPATETEPDFDLEIKEDVEAECSKYGRVKHIHVDRNSAGFVYVRFLSVDAAAKAQSAMHMRWFAQRSISAIFLQPRDYEAKFGK